MVWFNYQIGLFELFKCQDFCSKLPDDTQTCYCVWPSKNYKKYPSAMSWNTLIFQYDIHKKALKSQCYYPVLIEVQNAPLTYSPWFTELNLNEIQIYLRCKKHWHTLWVYILNLKFVAKYNRNLQTKILRKYTSVNLTDFFSLSDLDSSSSDSIYCTTANPGAATTSTASTTSIYCTTTLLENAGSWKRSTRCVTGFIFFQIKIE